MGKSDKKIKSDRINSLRKQYDAFLDEDKKRKERNEYILEKLDKMRYCTAVVPVRQKPTVFTETRTAAFQNVPKQTIEKATSLPYNDQRFLHLEIPRKNVDETILQEISKTYILIPKLKSSCDDYITDTKPKIDNNTDWKSKYQILDQLKRDEKEQDGPQPLEIFQADQANNNCKETTDEDDSQLLLKNENKMPDHIISENQLSYNSQSYPTNDTEVVEQGYYGSDVNDTPKIANEGLQNYSLSIENSNITNTLANNINNRFDNYEKNKEDEDYDQTKSNDNIDISDKNISNFDYVENVDESIISTTLNTDIKTGQENLEKVYLKADASQNNIENEYVPLKSDPYDQPTENDSKQKAIPNQETYLDKEEISLVQDINASNLNNILNTVIAPNNESNVVANSDYPVQTINVQDFTPHKDVKLEDGVNINREPQVLVSEDDVNYHYDPIVEIENAPEPTKTFDAEQTKEFYNEQADQNYDYTEEALVDNYDTEYTAPNENYEQNEYAYYEGAQTEQAYPESNDNEETLQRYDQNYEQQYGAYDQEAYPQQGIEQGYEQPEYTEQTQHFVAPDEAQQELEKVQYEENQDNPTLQYVEQQLDNEQGYAEKQDENFEIRNEEKQQNLQVSDENAQ